jgi:hypothetical protein
MVDEMPKITTGPGEDATAAATTEFCISTAASFKLNPNYPM